jgi:TolA-binding protein
MKTWQSKLILTILGVSLARLSLGESAPVAPGIDAFAAYSNNLEKSETPENKQKADAIRVTTIKTISNILRTSKPTGNKKFELTLRLSELLLERHDYLREIEYTKFQKNWNAWNAQKTKNPQSNLPEPRPDNTISKGELKNGIAILRKLVNDFPANPKTPKALYVLGQSMLLSGNDNAEEFLTRLVKNFPKSDVYPDGCLALGEFYFEKRKMSLAQENYKKALHFKEHKAFLYALYKLGWTNYNLAHESTDQSEKLFNQSLNSMKLVVKMTSKAKANSKSVNLHEEAINDLVVIWADAGKIDGALAFFKEVEAEGKYYDMLERLGNIYAEQGKRKDAMDLYKKIIAERPLRKRNPEVLSKMVEISEDGTNIILVADNIKNMNDFLAVDGAWSKEWQADKELNAKVFENRERITKHYGTKFHKINQKSANKNYAKASAKIYANYLENFPKHESSYEIRYYLADLLFTLEQPEASARQFLIVAQTPNKDKYQKDASKGAVDAAEENLVKSKIKDQSMAPSKTAIPLPKARALWKETIENYVKFFPLDPLSPELLFSLASTLFRYGHQPEAITIYTNISNTFPQTKQGKDSAKFVVEYEFERKNFDGVYSRASAYLKVPKLLEDKTLHTYLVVRIREAVFGKGLVLEEGKKFREAGDHFSSFQKTYPNDEIADRALTNAIKNYFKAGYIVGVVSASELLIASYPKSSFRADVLTTLAETHENMGEFEKAQASYMLFSSLYPNDPRSKIAVINAARLRKGLGKVADAKTAYLYYIKTWPSDPLVPTAKKELAVMLEQAKLKADAREVWQSYLQSTNDPEQRIIAEAHIAASFEDAAKDKAIRGIAEKLVNQKIIALEARSIVGEYLFSSVNKEIDTFISKMPLDSDKKKLEASIKTKNDFMVSISNKLVYITKTSSPEYIIAANVKLGDMHSAFSSDLNNLESSDNANKKDTDQLKNQLEKLALGLSDKAKDFYGEAWKTALDFPSFTGWTKTAYSRMAKIDPANFRDVAVEVVSPSYLGHRLKLTPETKSLGH